MRRSNPLITRTPVSFQTDRFVGQPRAVLAACQTVGARFQRAPHGGSFLVAHVSADDVEAALAARGHRIEWLL